MNAATNIESKKSFDLSPQSLDEAMRFADILATSEIVPKDFQNKPGNILVAIQWGMELGLKPMQAMQNIAVINGRPSLWGDAVIALVRSSPLCEYVYETIKGGVATCRVKRTGEEEQVRTFSEAEANEAGLLTKPGPWKQYKNRMLQMRARAYALRDVFPDVLKGIPIAEEVSDYQLIEKNITPEPSKPKEIAYYPQEKFEANFGKWEAAIINGKLTKENCLATIKSKGELTEEQELKINSIGE